MFDLTLSFDNGPEAGVTEGVLDALRGHGIRATFFVIGQKLAAPGARRLSERAKADGHWIGNHSWSHSTPFGELAQPGVAAAEITRTQELLGPLASREKLFRPFGGGGNLDRRLLNAEAVETLRRGGFTCIIWNAVPRDWVDPDGWVETALRLVQQRPWSLLVLHDMATGAMRHLPRFLDEAAALGARFRQDFPPDCVLMQRGEARPSMADYIADPPPAAAAK